MGGTDERDLLTPPAHCSLHQVTHSPKITLIAMRGCAAGGTSLRAMVVAMPVLVARALELLKGRSSQTTVLVEEGDLTRLPKLRLGELDLFVGRLEPV
ncbi:MAG: transcriptional regulator, LysR family [Polaromonas sp.]|nr:transcriptional regulator, LysR family [Polaromonas sp.]